MDSSVHLIYTYASSFIFSLISDSVWPHCSMWPLYAVGEPA